jgi:hypothetical protein
MADVWLPGAHIDRGTNAGYNSGRSQMIRAVAHYTVGADSRSVGRNGYFHFLVHKDASRENGCTQYAEVDAVTWHAAAAGNPYGPGVEWERNVTGGVNDEGLSNAEDLTPNQVEWGTRIVDFFAEWGIPVDLYDGPRYGGGGHHGWINHHDIDSQRTDGLLRAEWDLIVGGGGPPLPGPIDDVELWEDGRMRFMWTEQQGMFCDAGMMYAVFDDYCVKQPGLAARDTPSAQKCSAADLDSIIGAQLSRNPPAS